MLSRARLLATLSRAPPRTSSASARAFTSSCARSAPPRGGGSPPSGALTAQRALVLQRKADATLLDCRDGAARELEQLALALGAHDPQRTLERGYVLVQSAAGEPLASAAQAREAGEVRLRFAEGTVAGEDHPSMSRSDDGGAQSYEEAAARVEEIIRRLDSGEASLNETLELVREGKALIELCARELSAVGDALEELRLDELVSRLEQEASRMSTWELLAELPLQIEDYALEPLQATVSSEFERKSTVIRLRGAGQEGLGEDVTYDGVDHDILQAPARCSRSRGASRSAPSPSTWRGCRCSRSRPSARSRRTTARGRMSRRRSISRCARRTPRCTRRSRASRSPCASSSRCASASRRRSIPCARASSSTRGCASSSTPRAPGTSA